MTLFYSIDIFFQTFTSMENIACNKRVRIISDKDRLGKNARKKLERERAIFQYNSSPLPDYVCSSEVEFSWED